MAPNSSPSLPKSLALDSSTKGVSVPSVANWYMLPSGCRNGKGGMSRRRRITRTHLRRLTQVVGLTDCEEDPFLGAGPLRPAATAPEPLRRRSRCGGGSADHCSSGSSKEWEYCQPWSTSTRGCVKSSVQSDLREKCSFV